MAGHGRNTTTYARRIAFDMLYLRNWSLARDIKILFFTVRTLSTKVAHTKRCAMRTTFVQSA